MEVSTKDAASIIGTSVDTIRRSAEAGELPARRQGKKKAWKIELEKLREFADKFSYRYDHAKAQQLAEQ